MKKLFCMVLFTVLCAPCFGRHFANTVDPEEICTDCSDSSMFLYAGDYRGGYEDRAQIFIMILIQGTY